MLHTETIDRMMEGVKEVFASIPPEVIEETIKNWLSDVRYCSSPDTDLTPLTFAHHLEMVEKKYAEKKEGERKHAEAYANLSLAERAYGVTIDRFGNKTNPLSLGT